jgi:hypothetical protein
MGQAQDQSIRILPDGKASLAGCSRTNEPGDHSPAGLNGGTESGPKVAIYCDQHSTDSASESR